MLCASPQAKQVVLLVVLFALFLSSSCSRAPAVPKESPPTLLAAQFDPKTSGIIRGRVVWKGKAPSIDPIRLLVKVDGFEAVQPNPNAPLVDPKSGGMDQVLVYLRNVDPARSKPWSHAPVEVAFETGKLLVQQGGRACRAGIVQRGSELTFISHETKKHILMGRGAAFFSLPLLEPETPTRRKLEDSGIVELSSGAGLFWQRSFLWVGNHPYAAITNAAGEFELRDVPAGDYDIVCWSPNWHIEGNERHPEFGEIERLLFAPAVEQSAKITVRSNETATTEFSWSEADFKK